MLQNHFHFPPYKPRDARSIRGNSCHWRHTKQNGHAGNQEFDLALKSCDCASFEAKGVIGGDVDMDASVKLACAVQALAGTWHHRQEQNFH